MQRINLLDDSLKIDLSEINLLCFEETSDILDESVTLFYILKLGMITSFSSIERNAELLYQSRIGFRHRDV